MSLARAPAGVAIAVGDHGPGFPGGSTTRAWWYRGRQPSPAAGLGLGLRVVEALVRAQGGAVTYAETAGGGARVTVTLPAA